MTIAEIVKDWSPVPVEIMPPRWLPEIQSEIYCVRVGGEVVTAEYHGYKLPTIKALMAGVARVANPSVMAAGLAAEGKRLVETIQSRRPELTAEIDSITFDGRYHVTCTVFSFKDGMRKIKMTYRNPAMALEGVIS